VTRERAAISVGPGHDRPERARARLLTGEAAATAAAHDAHDQPRLDETSRRAIQSADGPQAPPADNGPAGSPPTAHSAGNSRHRAMAGALPGPMVRPTSPNRYA
jgi:hypothetical protein